MKAYITADMDVRVHTFSVIVLVRGRIPYALSLEIPRFLQIKYQEFLILQEARYLLVRNSA